MDPSIIERHPIGNGLDSFHEAFRSTCAQLGIPVSTDSADTVEQVMKNGVPESKELVSDLILALLSLRASRFLQSPDGRSTVGGELGSLFSRLQSNQQDPQVVVPLLTKVVERALDLDIWVAVYELITPAQQPTAPAELTPPQSLESSVELTGLRPPTTPKKSGPPKEFITPNKPIASKDTQTPTGYNTAGIVNSSEPRVYFDKELERELGTSVHVGVSGFEDAFFGEVSNLQSIAKTVFEKCQEGRDPLFNQERGGWQGWPSDAAEPKVLDWFQALARKLLKLPTQNHMPGSRMRVLRQHNKPVRGSVSRRKLDIGFVHKKKSLKEGQHNWSHILIPGELKSNPNEDTHSSTWHDLARYVREIFNAQESRRFVLGFTLCGSLMRLWEFDRLGAIASSAFDINQDGLRFVSTVLGYLWLTDEQLGFDPTITSEGAQRFITITKGATTERLVIDEVINRYPAINGRGTICWKVHPVGNESQTFVVKDSWQYPERDEEGEYLREAAQSGVVNVSRYYHHETVRVGGKDDTIVGNVRGGLDIGGAENAYKVIADLKREEEKQKKDEDLRVSISRLTIEKKSGTASSNTPAVASATLQEDDIGTPTRDRIHRRVILQDSGRPVYKASSRVALLAALEGAITGHESLHKAGILHRDISPNNVLVSEDENSAWPGFLIDLDLAIRKNRLKASGALQKTGTKVFMAIGALNGQLHSFMHDLESFFWALFWICMHYNGPNEPPNVVRKFDNWNYMDTTDLAKLKSGTIFDEASFLGTVVPNITPYFEPLTRHLEKLRKLVFPDDKLWKVEDEGLYERMREVLRGAMTDPEVQAG